MEDGRYEMKKNLEMEQHRPVYEDMLAFNLLFYLSKLKNGCCSQPQTREHTAVVAFVKAALSCHLKTLV